MCQGLTRSYGGLLACRFIMGIMEAGLPPGIYPCTRGLFKRLATDVSRGCSFDWAILQTQRV